jgi:hypothetical protein
MLAKHILTISDTWTTRGERAIEPNGRVLAIAGLIETCFGRDSAEAIAIDLITELDEFDEAQKEERDEPDPEARQEHMAGLLRKEFGDEA